MKLTEIFEIADKRTKGEWKLKPLTYQQELYADGIERDGVIDPYIAGLVKRKEDAHFLKAAPHMEAKLRDMVDMLPNIKTGLSIVAYSPDVMECERNGAKKTLEKLKQWGE
jgi:hypothetical protein